MSKHRFKLGDVVRFAGNPDHVGPIYSMWVQNGTSWASFGTRAPGFWSYQYPQSELNLVEESQKKPTLAPMSPFETKVRQLFSDAADLLLSKHQDYGPKNVALSPGGPINGLRVRLYDKLARLNNLYEKGEEPNHEAVEDTWRDIIGYGAIGLLVERGDWPDA